jgi:hypothetical protein
VAPVTEVHLDNERRLLAAPDETGQRDLADLLRRPRFGLTRVDDPLIDGEIVRGYRRPR